jgi:predicted anti-sigma-YlaC factor YlaD
VSISPTDCELARESVSVQLDGELAEQELDRLETHLRFCPECSAWAEQVREVTLRLRDAGVEVPAAGFMLSRHVRRWRVSSAVAVASAAAVVAVIFVVPGRQNASLGSLAAGLPANTTYDVAAGVAYPPHPVLGNVTLGTTESNVAPGPIRAL